ncbi:hypothetical protein GCM10027030_24680 [Luteococcus sediminum]
MSDRRLFVVLALAPLFALTGCGGDQAPKAADSPAVEASAASEAPASPVESALPEAAAVESASASPSASPSASASAAAPSVRPSAAVPKDAKKFATAKLPAKVKGYTGQVAEPTDGTSNGMYTGKSQDDMLMATLSPSLDFTRVVSALDKPTTTGRSTCGTANGVVSCFAQLDGGVLWVQGSNKSTVDGLAAVSNELYASFT